MSSHLLRSFLRKTSPSVFVAYLLGFERACAGRVDGCAFAFGWYGKRDTYRLQVVFVLGHHARWRLRF
jgi:hypothetical protein